MVSRLVFAILIVAASGVYAGVLNQGRVSSGGIPPLAELPKETGDWWSEELGLSEAEARVLDADLTLHRRYRRSDGADITLFLAYFAEQQVNSQIHSPRHCLPGAGWNVRSLEKRTLSADGGLPAMCMTIGKNDAVWDVFYWFRTRSGRVNGEYGLKWDLVKNSLGRRPTDAVFVRLSGPTADRDAMHDLITHLEPSLDGILAQVGL